MSARFDLGWVGAPDGSGRFVAGEPALAADAPLVQAGLGLFETMRVVGGRVPLLPRHLARLTASAAVFDLDAPETGAIAMRLGELLARAAVDDGVVRLTIGAPGVVTLTLRPRVVGTGPRRLAIVAPRRHGSDPTARHKTTSRAFWHLAQREAEERGADEAVVLDDAGGVAETSFGSVFALSGAELVTPPTAGPLLPGIARQVLLEGLRDDGEASVVERAIGAPELRTADAIWVTNAVHGARRAVLVDGGPSAAIDAGERVDQRLQALFARALARPTAAP